MLHQQSAPPLYSKQVSKLPLSGLYLIIIKEALYRRFLCFYLEAFNVRSETLFKYYVFCGDP